MKKVIYKYPFNNQGTVKIPSEAKVLSVQVNGANPTVWAETWPDSMTTTTRELTIVPTGEHFDSSKLGTYYGTFQQEQVGHIFVGHVYEITG